ncbi:response regulator transcription factor [Limosilactobacillus fermentum]|uniref:response regulator transcription factor n=1 Tax=Limosilactobacillus fermentum TaxID=1613 RepID=UPI00019C5FA4|nr:response regulator transcription factor [Limosilactobacillus fermentum]EEI21572.1 response regulator receiver domain protein [Limosilactobacillus fermentum ATCC 14931]MCH5403756.1 response regulator transcription factor [Limosilactobacillus fermentum]MDC6124895.1 response regulator transcription factor [Limosilactobacillus fermentum]MDG9735896.1 response regulator transcription factor [Limosilactobacillus fermentum]QCJ27094.1 response regulator transcription factor [Limosilactobacillus ferm
MNILLAEDEKQLSRALVTAMQANGYHVDPAYNGQEAVDLAGQRAYDVIILDIMMPKLNGIEALKQLRQTGNKTYVIMLTAMAEIDDKVTGLDAGADDYLTKPFSLKELLARLRSLERRSEDYQEDVLNFADITLDNDEQRLESHNSISLSGKETKLLAYLMKNPGKAIESSILLDQGWDKDDEADETDLWIYISYLRQKLQAVNAHVTIVGEKGGPFTLSQLA